MVIIIILIIIIVGAILSYFIIKNNLNEDSNEEVNNNSDQEVSNNSDVKESQNLLTIYKYTYNNNIFYTTNETPDYIEKYEIACENSSCKTPDLYENISFIRGHFIPVNDGKKFFIYDLNKNEKVYTQDGNFDLFSSDMSSEGTEKNNNFILKNNNSDKEMYYYANKNKLITIDDKVLTLGNIISADKTNYDPGDNIIIVRNKENNVSAINIDTEEKIIENVDSIYCYSHNYCYVLNNGVTTAYDFINNKYIKLDNDNILIMANGYLIIQNNKTYSVIDMNNNVIENITEANGMEQTGGEPSYENGVISINFSSNDKFINYKFNTNTKTSEITNY